MGIKKKIETVDRFDVWSFCYPEESDDSMMYEPFEETGEGYLKGRAIATSIGVFPYMMKDGSLRKELRLPEHVFARESLETLKLKPITDNHPSELVGVDNISQYQKGVVGEDIRNNAYAISVPMLITDKETIAQIKAGKRALSCGYKTKIKDQAGIWCGVAYDCIQTEISYNHLAIVDQGRAGDDAVMKMDSLPVGAGVQQGGSLHIGKEKLTEQKKEITMKAVKLDGADFDLEDKVAEKVTALQVKKDALETEKNDLLSKVSDLQGKLDSSNEQVTALKNDVAEAKKLQPEVIQKAVKERFDLLDSARKAGVEVKDDSSDEEVQKSVVLKVFPGAAEKLDKADAIYLKARFDSALEVLADRQNQNKKNDQNLSDLGGSQASSSEDKTFNAKEAKDRNDEQIRNAWKTISKEN